MSAISGTSLSWSVLSGTYQGGVNEPDWNLLDPSPESSDRTFERFIAFPSSFGGIPVVHLGLAGFDIDNADNARLAVSAGVIYPHGFTLRLHTWLNTRMWSVHVAWLAIGEKTLT